MIDDLCTMIQRVAMPAQPLRFPLLLLIRSFRLAPLEKQIPVLARDYREMQGMFYREPPSFADVLQTLVALENEINALR